MIILYMKTRIKDHLMFDCDLLICNARHWHNVGIASLIVVLGIILGARPNYKITFNLFGSLCDLDSGGLIGTVDMNN